MTPREPDRYEARAREVWASCLHEGDRPSHEPIAAALRQAESDALKRVADNLRGAANGWRIYEHATAEQAFEVAIRELLTEVRAIAPPAAVPATEPSEPVAPAPFRFAGVAAHDLLQADKCAVLSVDPETRRKLAAKLLAGLAAEAASPAAPIKEPRK